MDVREGTAFANTQQQLNFVDTFDWTAGAHQLKFGIDFRHLSPGSAQSLSYVTGQETEGFQALALGNIDTVAVFDQGDLSVNIDNSSLFAQDTWKATPRLTLTYGLRWEINTPPVSANSGKPLYVTEGIFDSKPLAVVPGALWHTQFGDVAPRVGAAWQITPKTVVRGGFGLFYDLGYGNLGDVSGATRLQPMRLLFFEPGNYFLA
jgi:outer membrane receptor protein involved in Fe transport